jgi:hypothetical protein
VWGTGLVGTVKLEEATARNVNRAKGGPVPIEHVQFLLRSVCQVIDSHPPGRCTGIVSIDLGNPLVKYCLSHLMLSGVFRIHAAKVSFVAIKRMRSTNRAV